MRKAILIAAGTVTGLGAVLSITPPAMSDSVGTIGMPAATPTKSATETAKPTVAATPTQAAVATAFSGTVNGASFKARDYGTVSVSVTFSNGKFKSISAQQSPTSWSQQSLSVLLPRSNSCNSRASYTAEAFWNSLKSAITKAGL
jgi:uncharacterized protein with FMN-binding domain